MQICTLPQIDNHASTPLLRFLQAGCPSCRPTNHVKALKDVLVLRPNYSEMLGSIDFPLFALYWHHKVDLVSCSGPQFRRPGGIVPKISKDLSGIFATPHLNFTLFCKSGWRKLTEQNKKQTNRETVNLVSLPYSVWTVKINWASCSDKNGKTDVIIVHMWTFSVCWFIYRRLCPRCCIMIRWLLHRTFGYSRYVCQSFLPVLGMFYRFEC